MNQLPRLLSFAAVLFAAVGVQAADDSPLVVDSPMPPPEWALLERELLRANTVACEEYFGRYFDDRGWLLCVERWGGDDGPDDAIENVNDWPQLHALGAPDVIRRCTKGLGKAHCGSSRWRRQRTSSSRDRMYFKVSRHVRLAAQCRRSDGLQPAGAV
jgi:hypothetical protein